MDATYLDLEKLWEENQRLDQEARRDSLTGLLNRGATEARVDELLSETEGGAILVSDLDDFKGINDRYGHIVGDQLLQKTAQLLGYMTRRGDVLGRVGGDEFVIFFPGFRSPAALEERCRMIQRRFEEFRETEGRGLPLSITIGSAFREEGDTYRTLFDRGDRRLLEGKQAKKRRGGSAARGMVRHFGVDCDVREIRRELMEQLTPGAYCQDYETFKSIYRFVERIMRRSARPACTILMTLTDGQGRFPELQDREPRMALLGDLVQRSLRSGDMYTRYSSCQYLLLVVDADERQADRIAGRICTAFDDSIGAQGRHLLVHYCYPLKPAGTEEPLD